jgi:aspartate kinase
MGIIVQKFGGTSVGSIERIKNVASLVETEIAANNRVVVIVSAMAGATNALVAQCAQISRLDKDAHLREYDAALASGEIITSALLALQLQTIGLKARSLQGWQIPFKTDEMHSNAQVTAIDTKLLLQLLDDGIIPVITGFQGVTTTGDVTTLGKGGSDTSAALIAAALNADRCDIYTDVDGIYTADPRIVHDAKKIDYIDTDELYELCASGAKVLHPRAALAAKRYGFAMRVLSSFTNNSGTIIQKNESPMENKLVTAITSNKNLLKIDIEHKAGNFSKILTEFTKESIITEQTYSTSNTNSYIITSLADKNKSETLLENLKNHALIKKYELITNISTVTVVGYGINSNKTLIQQIIEILASNNIEILASNSSDIKFSILINESDNEKLIRLLHDYTISGLSKK